MSSSGEKKTRHPAVTRALYAKVRRLLLDLARALYLTEAAVIDPGPEPENERAARFWIKYTLIHLADFGQSAAELSADRHARVLAVVSRTTYEYVISMIYLYKHRDRAALQMLTQGIRFLKQGLSLEKAAKDQADQTWRRAHEAWLADAEASGGSGLNASGATQNVPAAAT
jgi:hypothetical protein